MAPALLSNFVRLLLVKANIVNYITIYTIYYYVVTAEDATANVSAGSAEVAVTPNASVHAHRTLYEGAGPTITDTVGPDDGSGTINDAGCKRERDLRWRNCAEQTLDILEKVAAGKEIGIRHRDR